MELSKKNHGTVDIKMDGMTYRESYGKDDSDVTNAGERGEKMGGGITDIPGISGAKVIQRTNVGK